MMIIKDELKPNSRLLITGSPRGLKYDVINNMTYNSQQNIHR